jgi:hypothetical protein
MALRDELNEDTETTIWIAILGVTVVLTVVVLALVMKAGDDWKAECARRGGEIQYTGRVMLCVAEDGHLLGDTQKGWRTP